MTLLGAALPFQLADLGDPDGISTVVKIAILMTALAVLPSLLVLFSSFVRLIIILHFLRQAMGAQTVPPNHVLAGLALMLTFFVMAPVAEKVNQQAVMPYQAGEIDGPTAIDRGVQPVKDWMLRNTRESDLALFIGMAKIPPLQTRDQVPLRVAVPAFLISELKTGFQIGFLLFLPFLVIDLVVSSVLLSMGMMMLPPVVVSFPFKVLLFVLVDGWHLVVASVVLSFR